MTIQELRAQCGKALGFGSWLTPFDGSVAAYGELSAEDQAALANAMYAYIRAHPSEFSSQQVKQASTMHAAGPDTSSNWGVFVDEVANQADALNPFSEQNRAWFAAVVIGCVVIGSAAYFFAKGGGSVRIGK